MFRKRIFVIRATQAHLRYVEVNERDERGYIGGKRGQAENDRLSFMNTNMSPKLSPGAFLNRQLSLVRGST